MFCTNCGSPMKDGQKFCTNCGAPCQVQMPSSSPTSGNQSASGSRSTSGYAKIQPASRYAKSQSASGSTGSQSASGYRQNPTPPPNYVQPKNTNRSLLVLILLSMVTCSIYPLFFLYSLANDINDVCAGDGETTAGLVPYLLFSLLTFGIYGIFWHYKLCNRMAANAPRYGMSFQENGTTFLLWNVLGAAVCGIGPLVAMHIVIKNANALCSAYNQYNGLY